MKRIFIAATQQNDGKTTVALGLMCNLKERLKKLGFIKPIGQRYLEEEGDKIDEDSLLIERTLKSCGIRCGLKDTSPVAVERGFTEDYITNPQRKVIERKIKEAFKRVSKDRKMMIIEGTGHAGVGSVFDHSNAKVAKMLKSKVIIVSSGGLGRPIDEIVLNKSLFDREKVSVAGVIINKVLPEKYDKINRLIRKGLKRKGVDVLGVMPYNKILSSCTVKQIIEEANFELLLGESFLERRIERIIVGAMQAIDALKYFKDEMLVITPGDREDILSAALKATHADGEKGIKISGFILTGGFVPANSIMKQLTEAKIPVLLSKRDTYSVASIVNSITVKIGPGDKEKIAIAVDMAKQYLDMDRIMGCS
ncbi:MAG: AAA family ATPase [Candidatus Omnitrophica bacterium]|nr:AAA family ATPase [Candidatus Omnitrophota bacterium]